ncbi:YajD family HNH nuclease [Azospira restricta]|uniref:Putative HNH nuclease YajD n=1 Tax=Azospira restricta TaxID=404405 RepID=A0A974Y4G7_9RHOO|nr:YajD family HNH nuclease [Azospira restricta]QRJ64505.1 HNH nuclease family protein [Azospira restricta]
MSDEAKRRTDQAIAADRRAREARAAGYRAQALQLLPWLCARCGREFTKERLHELTVHHKDHDHTHNPPDGSNWELLCLYCHDNEHARELDAEAARRAVVGDEPAPAPASARPFAGLKDLLDGKAR